MHVLAIAASLAAGACADEGRRSANQTVPPPAADSGAAEPKPAASSSAPRVSRKPPTCDSEAAYRFDALGLCIINSEGWHPLSDDEFAKAISQVERGAARQELDRRLASGNAFPLLAFTKHASSQRADVNPTVQYRIIPRPARLTLDQIMDAGLQQMASKLENARVSKTSVPLPIAGEEGRLGLIEYTLRMKGVPRPLKTRFAIVPLRSSRPDNERLLQISGILPQGAPASLEQESTAMMLSVLAMK